VRIADCQFDHEAVELRLGQGECAFVLDGILRRDDDERHRQILGFAFERHLVFLHRFQQRGLGLGRRPVDLICQQDVGEDGTLAEDKAVLLVIVHIAAGDVAGQQVWGKLDALELHP